MADLDPPVPGGRRARRERAAHPADPQDPRDSQPDWLDKAWDTTTPSWADEPDRFADHGSEFDPFASPAEFAPEPEPEAPEPEPAAEPAAPTGPKGGRNLPAAIGVGVGLGAVVLAALFVWPPAALFVLGAALLVGTWELVRALGAGENRPPLTPLLVGVPLMIGLSWFGGVQALTVGLVLTVVAVVVWRLADGPPGYRSSTMAGVLVAVYVPFLGSFFALLLRPEEYGQYRVLAVVAAVVLSDTGGYISGVFLGRTPMAPTVSPKKSWEGFAGSVLACSVGGALMFQFLLDAHWWGGILFGVALAAGSTVGDLAESLLKRDLGIKDMGTLLPGHGGAMDRLDSLLLAAPLGYVLLTVLAPATGVL